MQKFKLWKDIEFACIFFIYLKKWFPYYLSLSGYLPFRRFGLYTAVTVTSCVTLFMLYVWSQPITLRLHSYVTPRLARASKITDTRKRPGRSTVVMLTRACWFTELKPVVNYNSTSYSDHRAENGSLVYNMGRKCYDRSTLSNMLSDRLCYHKSFRHTNLNKIKTEVSSVLLWKRWIESFKTISRNMTLSKKFKAKLVPSLRLVFKISFYICIQEDSL